MIFCSLNLGVSGVIRDPQSIANLEKFNSFGDLIYVILQGFEQHKGQARLCYARQFQAVDTGPQFHMPQIQTATNTTQYFQPFSQTITQVNSVLVHQNPFVPQP